MFRVAGITETVTSSLEEDAKVHSSTGKAPFEIVEGGKKVPPILHTEDKIFEADKYVQDMDEMYKKVKVALEKTQAKQKKATDRHRREVVFSLDNWVLLCFEKARLKKMKGKERLFQKLSMRYYGPFQVCDRINDVAYRLKLPENWKIHNAFHAKLSEKHLSWANFLSMFHLKLVHVAGKKNVVADALSRRPHVAAVSVAYQHELDEMQDHYSTDEDFVGPYDALVRGKHPDSYSLKDGFLMFRGKLCVSRLLRRKVMTESHSPPHAGHSGIDSTIKALEMYFFWPSLRKDTESFVRNCLVCQRVKYDRGKAYGLLQPLLIPTAPWESIAMDFIFGHPKTSSGNEGIWTIVDRFSIQAHFIPVRKQITAEQMAKIFLVTVFKYHGMPRSIVSDRDPRMTGLFWRALWQNLCSTLRFSSTDRWSI
ncbi:hypothetical protein L7F22_037815 [Adiantum nelumboides]|nr:hypothetical protein [Adiantum nelumboides]